MKIKNNFLQNLVLIGGGIMRKGKTAHIDRWMIRRQTKGKKKVKVLFIPAASGDLPEYIQDFTKQYSDYGAKVETLLLVQKNLSQNDVARKVCGSGLIYFGGGDVSLLRDVFKKYRLEELCKEAIKRRKALISGLSGGAVIWGRKFLNFERKGNSFINFRVEKGLGWVDKLIWPHFSHSMAKKPEILKLLDQNLDILAIGDRVAAFWDDKQRVKFLKKNPSNLGFVAKFEEGKLIFQSV